MAVPVTRSKHIQGFGEVRLKLGRFARRYPKSVAKAAKAELNRVKDECVAITPEDTGDLKDSIKVIEPEIYRSRIYTGITAGDYTIRKRGADDLTINYALKVHEDMEMLHPRGGEAKFIQRPWNQAAPHLAARITRRLDLNKVIHDPIDDE